MTFYFYDLETSGTSPRSGRVMQFAGQRTDTELEPIGEPHNILIKMTPDILPEPDAVLITGITPQQTHREGITEAEFLKFFNGEIWRENTIFVGYNNIRFDDEFMRFMMWRNFYDAYEWQWQSGCSRWDLLDVVRMTRALRPDGIKWPFDSEGKPSNRLELLSSINELDHANAHDALSDVNAAIAVARLIKQKQPKLFEYLLKNRGKDIVKALLEGGRPVVYTSGRYPSEHEKTTVAVKLAETISRPGALMYDLRIDPSPYFKMSREQLAAGWKDRESKERFPVKQLSYNKCPAVAPLSVLDGSSRDRLSLDRAVIDRNLELVLGNPEFGKKLAEAYELMLPRSQPGIIVDELAVDSLLYDGFVGNEDKIKIRAVRAAEPGSLDSSGFGFKDQRLNLLLPLYKARNFPGALNDRERQWWEEFRARKLGDGGQSSAIARYFKRLEELAGRPDLSRDKRYLLEELNIYGQSLLPGGY